MTLKRQARVVEQRKLKYPALARASGLLDDSIFSTADEATLAKLNAQWTMVHPAWHVRSDGSAQVSTGPQPSGLVT